VVALSIAYGAIVWVWIRSRKPCAWIRLPWLLRFAGRHRGGQVDDPSPVERQFTGR